MKNYQLRVVIEKAELEIKMNDLRDFISSQKDTQTLPSRDIGLLSVQLEAMKKYVLTLEARMEAFQ